MMDLTANQKEYDKGVIYIDQIKKIAGKYLNEYADSYPIVQSRIDKVFV